MTYKRPELPVRGPDRSPGGYYRFGTGRAGGAVFGASMQATEDAVVAAVRAGYRIADAQIERGMRIAEDLRGAARRAGAGEPAQLLAGVESLARRSMLLGVDWIDTFAAQPNSPLRRMLSAQYRLLGDLIGLDPKAWKDLQDAVLASQRKKGDSPASTPEREPQEGGAATAAPRIVFEAGTAVRAVEIVKWQVGDLSGESPAPLKFLRAGELTASFNGSIEFDPGGAPILKLRLSDATAEGTWKAAICSPTNELLGIVVVEL